jgi:hypothetical protein
MGMLYAAECDICGERQMSKEAFGLKGKRYTENGSDKFCCQVCDGKLKTALSLGKGGLDDPLKAAAGLLEQKDKQIRNLEMKASAKSGDMLGVADELRKKREGGSFVPVMGLDFETQYKESRNISSTGSPKPQHALPAPAAPPGPRERTKKRKK